MLEKINYNPYYSIHTKNFQAVGGIMNQENHVKHSESDTTGVGIVKMIPLGQLRPFKHHYHKYIIQKRTKDKQILETPGGEQTNG